MGHRSPKRPRAQNWALGGRDPQSTASCRQWVGGQSRAWDGPDLGGQYRLRGQNRLKG